MRTIVLCMLLVISFCASSKIYKVVNEDGTVVYTDKFQAGAEEMTMSSTSTNTVSSLNTPSNSPTLSTTSSTKKQERKRPNYSLSILQPANEATIRDNNGAFHVVAELTPLVAGRFQLFIDGELIQTQPNPRFSLQGIERGEHQLQVKFKHSSGKILASSPPVVIYLHQASKLITPAQ
ncbi:DUF4124 domain-containing protein [Aestuariibacter sp. AA17]|uniref:DUF4124 domain-containing protein n=1 Tax=Fluctibacter corallii TaxID=2984329 RepID=A0ABT3A4X8_9ALTE|nr:DUF4124 domain-containing protein [Aestuariibacter sp. AA17]MCV2883737.1 DUF4124 domain-containing protein [Aestuariibacter sp. AA17]